MIDTSIIIVFFAANLLIGYLASRRMISFDHFSVGNRAFGAFAICATLTASFIGGGYTVGNAAKVYSMGMIYAFALLGFSVKEILIALLVAPRMNRFRDCLSVGDIMYKCYGRSVKIVTGIFSLVICAGVLGAQVGAMGAIFHIFFGIANVWGIVIGFSIIIFYSSLGGMRAVVYTDILQFTILIVGIPLTFFFGLHHIGGFAQLEQKLPGHYFAFVNNGHTLSLLVILFITFMFGEILIPMYVQRLFMAKDARKTRNGTLVSGIISIPIFLLAGGIGLIANVLNSHLSANMALPYVIDTVLPVAVRGFVIAALLSIIMSSAAALLNASAIAFINDIVRPLSNNPSGNLLRWARLSNGIIGIGAVIFSISIKNVLDILLYAYNFWSPLILVPLLAVIFAVKATAVDFYIGIIGSIAVMLIWGSLLHSPFGINVMLVGIVGNLIFFTLSQFFRSR